MDKNAIKPVIPKTVKPVDVEGLPLLLGFGGFKPTTYQAQAVYLFLTSTENKSLPQIVGDITYDASLYYKWVKKPGFRDWVDKVCHTAFSTEKLLSVHAAMYREAMGNSPADRKLFMQRFDPKYTERSQQDQRHSFGGYDPPLADESRERQRKALANRVKSQPALPASVPGEQREDVRPANAITGAEPEHPVLAPTTYAQSPSTDHVQAIDTALGNDNTLDFKPITRIGTPGPGLQE